MLVQVHYSRVECVCSALIARPLTGPAPLAQLDLRPDVDPYVSHSASFALSFPCHSVLDSYYGALKKLSKAQNASNRGSKGETKAFFFFFLQKVLCSQLKRTAGKMFLNTLLKKTPQNAELCFHLAERPHNLHR